VNAATVLNWITDPRRRGLVLDLAVFLFNLILFYLLGRISQGFIDLAEYDASAKLAIGLFFVATLFLQPWGPLLKRRSFHARHPGFGGEKESLAGCWVAPITFTYLIMMLIIAGAASIMITEVLFGGNDLGATLGPLGVLGGLAWAVFIAVLFVRFFLPPKKTAKWVFLTSPAAERLGDITIFLNVLFLQIVWASVMSSALFWEVVINTPLGKPNSPTAIFGRFVVIAVVALMVYIPPRIYFLADQRHRRMAWITMLLANLPIILRALLATGK
jgi:hypothetical protein